MKHKCMLCNGPARVDREYKKGLVIKCDKCNLIMYTEENKSDKKGITGR